MVDDAEYLEGQMLIAMPGMEDPRFQRTLIYMCAHSDLGAMGLVVNKVMNNITFPDLLEQLDDVEQVGPGERRGGPGHRLLSWGV